MELPRWQTEPEAVVADVVAAVDPSCGPSVVTNAVERVFRQRPQRRELARILECDPSLLTSGLPQVPRLVERLIRDLVEGGASGLVLPRCAACDRQRPLTATSPQGRICGTCYNRSRTEDRRCVECGRRDFCGRDRQGRPRCRKHLPDQGIDPAHEIAQLLAASTGLEPDVLAGAVRQAERSRAGQLRLWWALSDRPDLLTGAGAHGPQAVSALAKILVDHGARSVVVPLCPWCTASTNLVSMRDGVRCCSHCWAKNRTARCARCDRNRPVSGHDGEGRAVCGSCRQKDPLNHRRCDGCGQTRLRRRRTEDGGGLCPACCSNPYALCATCGAWRPCWFASTPAPRCQPCTAKARHQAVCVGCGQMRRVNNRTAEGEPLCATCGTPPSPCDGCGKTYRISALVPGGRRLCQTCWSKHPGAKKPCERCGTVARLFHRGMCPNCARDRSLCDVFAGSDGRIRPELQGVVELLRTLDGRTVLRWVHKAPARRAAFRTLATASGPVTHASLDAFADEAMAEHLRALLVAHGVLAVRDEHLARIEKWLPKVLGRLPDVGERRIVERWARWQPLRRLHRQPAHRPTSPGQACGIRHEIRSVVRLLEWLPSRDSSLATCTQHDIDDYLSTGSAERLRIRSFLHWTSRHQHTRALTAPYCTSSLATDIVAADIRWSLVHRLVQEPGIAVRDRTAGLLLLLFAQPPSRICALTREDVLDDGTILRLRLGTHPVEIPPPLDNMVREVMRHPVSKAHFLEPGPSRWLFPGSRAGRPMEPVSMSRRLKALGIRPRPTRNASLMDLAAELPAIVFSRLLGFSEQTAANWMAESGGEEGPYAAHRARRADIAIPANYEDPATAPRTP
ncbi:hypothetical protein ACFWR9_08365 [Streptomyces sp. NPDC058534]|uniref:hypothetical protein n=1 Tax=Streptomyces sp. NPDC058534 TaxID=3346541 RepID=UPI00365E0B90